MFKWLRSARVGSLLAALITFALLLSLILWAGDWYESQLRGEQRARAAVEVSARANALTATMNRRLARLQGLHSFVQTEADSPAFAAKFETYAAGLYAGSVGVRNIAVGPDGAMRYVYPLTGNETVLGYNPATDPRPEVRNDVHRARLTGEIVLTGPIELVQGGLGLIARQAVYRDGAYWGLVNIVLDVPLLLAEAGVAEAQPEQLQFALRNDKGEIFSGSPSLFSADPIVGEVQLVNETWELAAVPLGGWSAPLQRPMLIFKSTTILISTLLAALAYLVTDRQVRLSLAVDRRTRQLSRMNQRLQADIAERKQTEARLAEQEEQYRSIFESTMDALFIFDLEDARLVDFNPAAHELHGYTAEEFARLKASDFIHPDYYHFFETFIAGMRDGRSFRSNGLDLRKDGSSFPVDVLCTPFTYRRKPHMLAILRDITEQVEAYRLLEQRVEERTLELQSLLTIGRSLTSTLELKPLLVEILEQLTVVIESADAAVLTLDEKGQELTLLTYRSPVGPGRLPRSWPVQPGSLDDDVISGRMPVIIPDVLGDSPHARLWQQRAEALYSGRLEGVRSWMGVPLLLKDRVVGILMFGHSTPDFYHAQHAEMAMAFGSYAAVAIENARLYERARSLAVLEERQRLARELHDSVSQALYGVALGARTARTLLDRSALEPSQVAMLSAPLDYVLSLAEAALTEMRALIFELRPETLAVEGLVAALARQTDALRARYGLDVVTQFNEEPDLPLPTKEALYRVAQEALNNVVKHAAADQVSLSLATDNGTLQLEIRDNGRGFNVDGDYPGHLGLRSMQERIEALGGTFTVSSGPQQGTCIEVRLGAVQEPGLATAEEFGERQGEDKM